MKYKTSTGICVYFYSLMLDHLSCLSAITAIFFFKVCLCELWQVSIFCLNLVCLTPKASVSLSNLIVFYYCSGSQVTESKVTRVVLRFLYPA